MVVVPAPTPVTTPSVPTEAMPGSLVAHLGVGVPVAPVIVAVKVVVAPIAIVIVDGATATVMLPTVALTGTSPVKGVSVSETVVLFPACTFTVAVPSCVSAGGVLASKARTVMTRLVPTGIVIAPLATPLLIPRLKTSGVGMPGPVTSTTTIAAVVADTSAVTINVACPSGGGVTLPAPQAAMTNKDVRAARVGLLVLRTMGPPRRR